MGILEDPIHWNAAVLDREFEWLSQVITLRMGERNSCERPTSLEQLPPPELTEETFYTHFIRVNQVPHLERLAIILAMTPHLKASVLNPLVQAQRESKNGVPEVGGILGKHFGGMLPTGETLAYLAGGSDLAAKLRINRLFEADHPFAQAGVLSLQSIEEHEPPLNGILVLDSYYLDLMTTGNPQKPTLSSKFPAKLINTQLNWEDLVIEDHVLDEVRNIISYIAHRETIYGKWGLGKVIKPGYKALFHGPPGTGKTFTASLVGKTTGKDVYKVDLSMVVSKWVGETEKNLRRVFDNAERKDWILFFDEADSLFGKRTETKSSQERYANQEVAYLLQRLEDFPGTVILASNLKTNMDEAFTRRFHSMVFFPIPKKEQRLRIWRGYLDQYLKTEPQVDLESIAARYELTGGSIINILKYCAIKSAEKGIAIILEEDLLEGIRRELAKEGKIT